MTYSGDALGFSLQFALREPRALILGVVAAALIAGLWGARGTRRARPLALLARLLAVAAFSVALAGPSLARPAPTGATVFVVDLSRSMGAERLAALEAQLAEAIRARGGAGGRAQALGIVAFAERPTVLYPVGASIPVDPPAIRAALDGADVGSRDHTALTDALRLAEALPTSGGKRLVLFSDGQETLGDARGWASGARERGVTVDAVPPRGRSSVGDVRLTDLRVPESLWQGEEVEVETVVNSDAATRATVRLVVDGQASGEQAIDLRPGSTTHRFLLKPLAPGYHALRVDVTTGGADSIAENNTLGATTVVRDKPRVLVLSGEAIGADRLRRALERTGSDVAIRRPESVTERLSDLAAFDAIVLVDVPATRFNFEQQKALQEYVRTLGKGLVVTGGVNSFGRGGYEQSILEETLPVTVKPRGEGKRQPVALLLIIDTSYSMDFPRGEPTRMEMAKAAAAGAVRALSPGDQVAVLAFSDGNNWVTRLRSINNENDANQVADQIGRLKPDGVTRMREALAAGIDELATSQAPTKHIILLSDGAPSDPINENEVASRIRRGGLTLSTIAIGDGADTALMERLAKGGHGRYAFARRPEDIPRLTLEEAEQVGGKTLATGDFRAVQTAPSSIMRGIDPARLPTIGGYQIAEVKPDAQLVLASGRNEPVLAQWQYGLGRVVAWTSDLSQDLAPNWRDADSYAPFWNQAVRWTLAEPASRHFRVRATPRGRDVLLTIDALGPDGAPVNLADTRATVRTPAGASLAVTLPQSGPGRYEVPLAAPAPGAYRLEIRQMRGGSPVTDVAGFSVPYPAELRGSRASEAALSGLVDRTGGRTIADARATFDGAGETRAPRFQPVWPWFAALGLACFLLDIALRLAGAATPRADPRRLLPR